MLDIILYIKVTQIMNLLLVVIMNQSKDMYFLTIVICLVLEPFLF